MFTTMREQNRHNKKYSQNMDTSVITVSQFFKEQFYKKAQKYISN